jgi:hypothetical protein
MGIEEFSTGKRRSYHADSNMAGQPLRTLDKALDVMKSMENELGHFPTAKEWNNMKSDFGITTAAASFKRMTGHSYGDVKNEAGYTEEHSHQKALELLEPVSYDPDAMGHIYVLQFSSVDFGDSFYYVGATEHMHDRVAKHIITSGDFHFIGQVSSETVMSPKHDVSIDAVCDVDSVYSDLEGQEFKNRLSYLERVKYCEVVRQFDTNKVFGGFR